MRGSRILTALLLAAAMAVATRTAPVVPSAAADDAAAAVDGIGATGATSGPVAFLAASPAGPVAAADGNGRPPLSTFRLPHFTRIEEPAAAPVARLAALRVGRLAFARELDAARLAYFSFGSTAPPPFHG